LQKGIQLRLYVLALNSIPGIIYGGDLHFGYIRKCYGTCKNKHGLNPIEDGPKVASLAHGFVIGPKVQLVPWEYENTKGRGALLEGIGLGI
jgi:hypothetical protein